MGGEWMYRVGDWVRLKTVDELIKTYRDKRIIEAIHHRNFFENFGITFIPRMYHLCGAPVKIEEIYENKSMLVNNLGHKYCVIPEWLVADKENTDFNINEKEILSLI